MKNGQTQYFKYFPVSDDDFDWGVFIENIGKSIVPSDVDYPLPGHPDTYYFTWDKGRYLSNYQLILITEGQGVFESTASGSLHVKPGTVILLFPNQWHRYKPSRKTGWKEYWIGFGGALAHNLVRNNLFTEKSPLIMVKNPYYFEQSFETAINYSIEEKPGFQQIVVGHLFQIFGHLISMVKSKSRQSDSYIQQINKAREIMQDKASDNVDLQDVANELNVDYAIFRKKFKEFTGMSPKQYQIQLKLNHAKSLLLGSDLPVKFIAFESGYESIYHFSKIFKEKTGYSPSEFRMVVKDNKNNHLP